MQLRARPRVAFIYPILAVLAATAFLLLVALSIALQPPRTDAARPIDGALAWLRAVFFSAGALAFLVGIATFARTGRPGAIDDSESIDSDDVTGFAVSEEPVEPQPEPEPRAVFTLIALTRDAADMRAIADFADARALLTAVTEWRREHPEEQLRIFDAQGEELARHAAAREAAPVLTRVRGPRSSRPGLVAGGAS
jgi:hypothetical protein